MTSITLCTEIGNVLVSIMTIAEPFVWNAIRGRQSKNQLYQQSLHGFMTLQDNISLVYQLLYGIRKFNISYFHKTDIAVEGEDKASNSIISRKRNCCCRQYLKHVPGVSVRSLKIMNAHLWTVLESEAPQDSPKILNRRFTRFPSRKPTKRKSRSVNV